MAMPGFLKLMIGGWVTTAVMIGICALNESGALLRFSRRLGDWLEQLAPQASDSTERAE